MTKLRFASLVRLALILLVAAVWLAGVALPTTLAQEPPTRPNPPPDVPGPPPGRTQPPQIKGVSGGGGHGDGGDAGTSCMTVHGVAINWGYRNEPKLPVLLSGSDWLALEITDDNGYYASDCLGQGIGLVNPVSPPWLRPMTRDVAIRLGYRQTFEVNLGLYGGKVVPNPDVMPVLAVNPTQAQPGEIITYTIRVTNTLGLAAGSPPAMGEVMITDLLPETLTPVSATSTVGQVELWGNLLTVDIGTLFPGQPVAIIVTAKVHDDAAPAGIISNRATLLHTGHVAAQTPSVDVAIGP